jgi:hypothetical protein
MEEAHPRWKPWLEETKAHYDPKFGWYVIPSPTSSKNLYRRIRIEPPCSQPLPLLVRLRLAIKRILIAFKRPSLEMKIVSFEEKVEQIEILPVETHDDTEEVTIRLFSAIAVGIAAAWHILIHRYLN